MSASCCRHLTHGYPIPYLITLSLYVYFYHICTYLYSYAPEPLPIFPAFYNLIYVFFDPQTLSFTSSATTDYFNTAIPHSLSSRSHQHPLNPRRQATPSQSITLIATTAPPILLCGKPNCPVWYVLLPHRLLPFTSHFFENQPITPIQDDITATPKWT